MTGFVEKEQTTKPMGEHEAGFASWFCLSEKGVSVFFLGGWRREFIQTGGSLGRPILKGIEKDKGARHLFADFGADFPASLWTK